MLVLATLRSPFLPVTYAAVTPLWLLTLLGAENVVRGRALTWIGLAWLAFELVWPVDWPLDPRVASAINLVPMATMLALVVLAVRSDMAPRACAPRRTLRLRPRRRAEPTSRRSVNARERPPAPSCAGACTSFVSSRRYGAAPLP